MAKLWDKGYELDAAVERFTVGRDYLLDRELIVADAAASIAHARMLETIAILSAEERLSLEVELRLIATEGSKGAIEITRAEEDCHTAIESRLVERLGEAGKKVHTGRSRNDQIAATMRLYTREALLDIADAGRRVVTTLLSRAEEEAETVMPGRTHLQIAMLSTLGLWFASWAEQLLDDFEVLTATARLNDRSPLGSAASYGTSLPLDREAVARELGFSGVQNNVLAVQHSRGALDAHIAGSLSAVAVTLSRMAQDLILFSLPELGYVRLPEALCSGSSIMPQKRNPDVLELLRSRAAVVDGWAAQCRGVVRALPSGYNRDLQDTKEPLLRALATVEEELAVTEVLVLRLEPQRERMRTALDADVFATDYAYRLVEEGIPFREAYRRAAADYRKQRVPDPAEALRLRRSTGTPGNLNLPAAYERLEKMTATGEGDRARHTSAVAGLLGDLSSVRPLAGG